jgi:hypothetical protein
LGSKIGVEKRITMNRVFILIAFLGLVLGVAAFSAASVFNEGMVDRDLRFEGFSVTDDGFVTGTIVNTSKRLRQAVRMDMWITNIAETRIFWRKSLVLGDMPPGARVEVRENANGSVDSSLRLQFKFRIPQKENFRN